MHRRPNIHTLLLGASTLAMLTLNTHAYAQGAFGGADVGNVRGNSADKLLDKTRDDDVLEELKERSKKKELDVDEAEKDLGSTKPRSSSILDNLPSADRLRRIKQQINAEPNNLDHYFEYAQMATALGEHEQAIWAYESMLKKAPKLDRVRLDLGVAYMRIGKLEEAKTQLETVLKRNPPEQVVANINKILSQLNIELATYDLGGSVSFGLNYDSNANSAPSENAIVIFDTEIPLGEEQKKQSDIQAFGAASLQHTYKPKWAKGEDLWGKWNSSISVYQADQSSLENLDLKVLSLKTGAEIRGMKSGFKVRPEVGYSHISLAGKTYLKTFSPEISAEYPISNRIILTTGAKHEWREFENAPDVSTYADRTGSASQAVVGTRVILDEKHFLNAQVTARKERTRRDYYDNKQLGATIGLTKLLPYDMFLNAQAGYKNTVYRGADALISSKRRHDKERTSGITLGAKLTDDITATIGYQYRDVNSNIINYKYDNHRFSSAISIRF